MLRIGSQESINTVTPSPILEDCKLKSAILNGDLAKANQILKTCDDMFEMAKDVIHISQNVINPNEECSDNSAIVAGEMLMLIAEHIHAKEEDGDNQIDTYNERYELLERIVFRADELLHMNEHRLLTKHQISMKKKAEEELELELELEQQRQEKQEKQEKQEEQEEEQRQQQQSSSPKMLIVSPPPKQQPSSPSSSPSTRISRTSPGVQSALSAAVREIQNLRRQLSASEARYVSQNKSCEEKIARQSGDHAIKIASIKHKVSLEVSADRMISKRISTENMQKVIEEARTAKCVALGQAETRHHAAMHQMKQKFQKHLATVQLAMVQATTKKTKSFGIQTDMAIEDNKDGSSSSSSSSLAHATSLLEQHETLEELATKILAEEEAHTASKRRSTSAPPFQKFVIAVDKDRKNRLLLKRKPGRVGLSKNRGVNNIR